jgi:cell division control protein 12
LNFVGESGLGKTTLVNTLFTTTVLEPKNIENRHQNPSPKTAQIEITKAHIEEKGFRVELTLVDTPGFADGINKQNAHVPIVKFVDDQHESFLRQEAMARRAIHAPAGAEDLVDMRVHACLYFIPPHNRGLRVVDIEAMKALSSRVNLIPVIAKADTVSRKRLVQLKEEVRKQISENDISVYTCPIEEDDKETTQRNIDLMSAMPFSVIGCSSEITTPDGRRVLGRQYKWGLAEGRISFIFRS